MQLAGRDARLVVAVRHAVDRQRTRSADAFAAIRIVRDRLLAAFHRVFVDDVEHLQKRRAGRDVLHIDIDQPALALAVMLPPDFQVEIHKSLSLRLYYECCWMKGVAYL